MEKETKWAPVLLCWYASHGRQLPWRTAVRDPYKVWVSEIMLQQTKVEAVRPYYESWMDRFPTMEALASASEDDVLRQWQGLGYYSRARNLHTAVQEVEASYGGVVPKNRKDIVKLKGVGDYTAGAILSIAYGEDEAAVDGNVLRVFARLYGIEENILSGPVKKHITALVTDQLPHGQAGPFNEALMDFGATVCIPKSPRCGECPLAGDCTAHQEGKEKTIPLRLTKKNVPTEDITVAIVSYGPYWLIHRRPARGLLASMWEFPNASGCGEEGKRAVTAYLASQGVTISLGDTPVTTLKHVFSHKIWQMTVYEAWAGSKTLIEKEDWQWLRRDAYTTVPWAGPHGKLTALSE